VVIVVVAGLSDQPRLRCPMFMLKSPSSPLRIALLTLAAACSKSQAPSPPDAQAALVDEAGAPLLDTSPISVVGDAGQTCDETDLASLEAQIAAGLDTAAADPKISSIPDVTLLLETMDGRRFAHSHGDSSATTRYESASTSKLVAAVVIMDAVDHGFLSLDSKAHDLIPFWDETQVTLRHLLSFTSGFSDEPVCIDLGISNYVNCVQSIFTKNSAKAPAPGTQFYYSSAHLQVAGLMVMNARSLPSWTAVFDDFKSRTGLFPTSAFDLPSASNPRLAGGMHWTAEEYLAFLRALVGGRLLTQTSRAQLFANQRGAATVAYSPTIDLGEDWAYGLGNWLECPTATTANSFNCGAGHRNSSPGAYGAYPFIDFDDQYFGIVARQGGLKTYPEGVHLFRAVQPLVSRWARRSCGAE
jgi:CubicO group peptidase (beta-lactamase class C family)